MVTLRATQKLLRALPAPTDASCVPGNALGDWYVNRIVVDRRPLLLLVSSKSLLAILAPARDVRSLPDRLAQLVGARLRRLPVSETVLAAEVLATAQVCVGKTIDRSVTGHLVDFSKAIPHDLPVGTWDERALRVAEDRLEETPCRAGRKAAEVVWPRESAVALLNASWSSGGTRNEVSCGARSPTRDSDGSPASGTGR